jgi:3-phenylpropionate/trans-cinnamate dioxygenase ferredoxin reductase subunit
MLGSDEPYRELPYFFSDLADWASVEAVGPADAWDEVVIRGDLDGGEFSAWYLEGGRVKGALSVGRSEDLIPARALIEDGVDVSATKAVLKNVDVDLCTMLRQ